MTDESTPITRDELEEQHPELLPEREAMSVIALPKAIDPVVTLPEPPPSD